MYPFPTLYQDSGLPSLTQAIQSAIMCIYTAQLVICSVAAVLFSNGSTVQYSTAQLLHACTLVNKTNRFPVLQVLTHTHTHTHTYTHTPASLKFDVQPPQQQQITCCFLSCDAFFVEVGCHGDGRITGAKLVHTHSQVCSPLPVL